MSIVLGLLILVQEANVQLEQADKIFQQGKYAEASDGYRKALQLGETERNLQVQVEALAQVARCCSLVQKLDEGRPWLEKAGKLASKEEPLGYSRYLCVRGIFERESGDKPKAKATFLEMYDYCRERKLHRRAVDAVHHVAIVVPVEEQPDWALKGIREAEELKDDGWLAILWNNLGATYEDLKKYDAALDAYTKAKGLHYKSGDDRQKLIADWSVGHALRLAGKTREARELLEKTLAWAQQRHAKEPTAETLEWVGWCKKDLGETLVALKEKAKGLAMLKEGRKALVEAGIEKWWPEGLKKVDEAIKAIE